MFALLFSNIRLIGTGAAVIAVCILAYVVNGWRDDSKALALERAQYRQAVEGFNEQIRQIQEQEQKAREAERAYQIRVSTMEADIAAMRTDNRRLRLVAYRVPDPITIPARIPNDPTPEPERDSGTPIDLESLYRFAYNCQADAEQLAAFQGWSIAR